MRSGNTHQTTTPDTGHHGEDVRTGVRGQGSGQARRRTAAASIVLTVAVTTLAGCTGGDPAPDWTPTTASPIVQPTPTPSTDPATIKPERPTAMDTFDSAGAEATAVYFLELVPYANATGDVTLLAGISAPECGFCRSVQEGVDKLVTAGQHTAGGTPEVTLVNSLESDQGKWWTVDVELVQTAQQVIDKTGTTVAEIPSAAFHMDVAVVREGDKWLVKAVSHERLPGGNA